MSLAGAPPLSTPILFIAPPDLVVMPEIDVYVAPGRYIFPTRLGVNAFKVQNLPRAYY
jgi:hypothetical protein